MADKLMVSIADCDSFSASIVVFSKVSIVPFVWSKRDRQLVSYGPNVPVHPLLEGFGIVNSVLVGVQQVC